VKLGFLDHRIMVCRLFRVFDFWLFFFRWNGIKSVHLCWNLAINFVYMCCVWFECGQIRYYYYSQCYTVFNAYFCQHNTLNTNNKPSVAAIALHTKCSELVKPDICSSDVWFKPCTGPAEPVVCYAPPGLAGTFTLKIY